VGRPLPEAGPRCLCYESPDVRLLSFPPLPAASFPQHPLLTLAIPIPQCQDNTKHAIWSVLQTDIVKIVRLTYLDELSPPKLVIRKLNTIVYDSGNLHDAILRNSYAVSNYYFECPTVELRSEQYCAPYFKSDTDLQASLGIAVLSVLAAVREQA
jgi:hypothetical protein